MKKLSGFIRLSGIIAFLLVVTATCSQTDYNSSSKLIGKWEMIAGEQKGKIVKLKPPYQVIEFFSDNTLDFHGISFTWAVLKDARIKLTMSIMGAKTISYASLQGDTLKIPDPNFGDAFRLYKKKGASQLFGGYSDHGTKDQSQLQKTNLIIGKWQRSNPSIIIEFNNDGSWKGSAKNRQPQKGNYKLLNNDRIELLNDIFKIEFPSDDTLILQSIEGQTKCTKNETIKLIRIR
jgi:hypothetical protein